MMQVNSLTPTPSSSSSSTSSTQATAAATATVNYNEFLQLLIAEMQNQDPTQPTDPTQYMSQLASFSEVEQSVQTNNTLSSMLTSSALSQAEQAIGHTVTSADGSVSGKVVSVTIGSTGTVTATLDNGSTLPLASGVTIGS
jgi:flagellar basal-body rod modification protein FlgD